MRRRSNTVPENLNDLEIIQTKYDRHYDYITQGIIIRSRVNGYEQGEKSNKYIVFFELRKRQKEKEFHKEIIFG